MTTEELVNRALIAFAVAFGLWLIKEVFEGWRRTRQATKQYSNLVRALYSEIDFNTRDMEKFLHESPDEETLRKAMSANPKLVPHITDARHTEIYRNRIGELHSMSDKTLSGMVHFYGMLEKVKAKIDAVNYQSFQSVSIEGRMFAVMGIVRSATTAKRFGIDLLNDMAKDHKTLKLKRFDRNDDMDAEQLKDLKIKNILTKVNSPSPSGK
jgi:hypothetical protein